MLCNRCEHRARFIEDGRRPRSQCGDIGKSNISCYMYKPVAPVILKPDEGDNRPRSGEVGSMLSGRATGVRISKPIIELVELEDGEFSYNIKINK